MSHLIKPEDLVGLTERSAVRKIENARLLARVIFRDGEQLFAMTDIEPDRINLSVENGEVKKAWVG